MKFQPAFGAEQAPYLARRRNPAPTEGKDAGRGGQERRTAAGKGKKRKAAALATTGGEVDGGEQISGSRGF